MVRLMLRNLAADRVRFAMTTLAVVLAVSFVVSSFVLTDGLRATFADLSAEIVDGTDLEIRPAAGEGDGLSAATLAAVQQVDGVRAAAPIVEAGENTVRPLPPDGEEISTFGPPQLAFGWVDDEQLSSFAVVEGSAPDEADEFAMDVDSAARHGFEPGTRYDVVTPTGLVSLTLSATTTFGDDNDTLGAVLMQFPLEALQEFVGMPGYHAIGVALEPGADVSSVIRALADAVPTAEVVDHATLESEQRAEFDEDIDVIGNILLGFAGISLFVSIFIISNTFSIVLGQRTRELALLRTIGADPVQLRRTVRGEAAAIGTIASAVGIAAGVGLAYALRALFGAIGAELPDSPVVLSVRTIVIACAVGVLVTVLSALGPARRAARVAPIAALRDGAAATEPRGRTRLLVGAGLAALGLAAGSAGLFASPGVSARIGLLAVGAIGIFVGVTSVAPLATRPLTRALGWPLRSLGVSGRLAQQNAGRNPRRTSSTASALMIGLALVTTALVVGESVKAQLRSTLASSVRADHIITEDAGSGFPPGIAEMVAASPVTTESVAWSYDWVRVDGHDQEVAAADHRAVDELFDLGITDGVAVSPSAPPVLISDEEALSRDLTVGDTVRADFANGTSIEVVVAGIYTEDVVVEQDYLFDRTTWVAGGADDTVEWLALSTGDASEAELAATFAAWETMYPLAAIEAFDEFVDRIEGAVDQALTAVNLMVALAIVIALIGIANTLALSVVERTRELGLLRAVGMSRRQLRRMVRAEAALVALFGAGLGVALGLLFGWAAVAALPASVTATLDVPVARILVLVALATIAGLIAAWAPARRAGRLDVLQAIGAR